MGRTEPGVFLVILKIDSKMKFIAVLLVLVPVIFGNPVDKRFLVGKFQIDLSHSFSSVTDYVKEHILTPGMETSACSTACKAALPGGALYCDPVCSTLVSSLNGK